MAIVGCYTLHLYCDAQIKPEGASQWYRCDMGEYVGETAAQCRRQARRAGWKLGRTAAVCPTCAAAGAKVKDYEDA